MLLTTMKRLLVLALSGLVAGNTASARESLFDAVTAGNSELVKQALSRGDNVESRAPDQATPLIAAALSNQPVIVELLLSHGASVSARNSGGFTPLHAAAYAGSASITKLLLARGAPLDDAVNKAGVTPLMVAGEENHVEVATLLIAQGADPRHPEIHGYLPITRALWKGNKDIVHLYKQHGVTCPPIDILGGDKWYQQCLVD
jgi:ankyrin repeat protein